VLTDRATDWVPLEISIVPAGANAGAVLPYNNAHAPVLTRPQAWTVIVV
jgi:hypothetical protein